MSALVELIADVFFGLLYLIFRFIFYYIGFFFAKMFGVKGYEYKVNKIRLKVRRFSERRSNFKSFIGFLILVVLFYIILYIIKFLRNIN